MHILQLLLISRSACSHSFFYISLRIVVYPLIISILSDIILLTCFHFHITLIYRLEMAKLSKSATLFLNRLDALKEVTVEHPLYIGHGRCIHTSLHDPNQFISLLHWAVVPSFSLWDYLPLTWVLIRVSYPYLLPFNRT